MGDGYLTIVIIPFDGILVALPETSPTPSASTITIDPTSTVAVQNNVLTLGTTEYDLTDVPTDPPHRIYGLPEGTEIPGGAIVLTPIEEPAP
jgi:hypothetical protein